MDEKLPIHEEHERIDSTDSDNSVSEITFREYENDSDLVPVCGLVYSYYKVVANEDTDGLLDVPLKDGTIIKVIEAEAELYRFLAEGAKIQLALWNNVPVGFMVYHQVFPAVIAVRVMYYDINFRVKGLGRDLLNSIGRVKKVLFQTHRDRPPETLLTSASSKKIIDQGEKYITWEMNWEQD